MKNTFQINFTHLIASSFEWMALMTSVIAEKKAYRNVKPIMLANVDVPSFLSIWGKIEDKADPSIAIEPGKNNFITVTEKEITEYLKLMLFIDKVANGRHFIYVKDEFNEMDALAPDIKFPSAEERVESLHALANAMIRLAKMRWRNNRNFLAEITKIEKLTV